jgi:hypothetical protein
VSAERPVAAPVRLRGSGLVPRVFALTALGIVSVFLAVWLAGDPAGWPLALVPELALAALAVRSLFVGVYLVGDGVLVRGWLRDLHYGPGELTAIEVQPYWRFLDPKDPILGLLAFRPAAGWVREPGASVAPRERILAHAAELRRHLGLEGAA